MKDDWKVLMKIGEYDFLISSLNFDFGLSKFKSHGKGFNRLYRNKIPPAVQALKLFLILSTVI
jgi:hypothetical protein